MSRDQDPASTKGSLGFKSLVFGWSVGIKGHLFILFYFVCMDIAQVYFHSFALPGLECFVSLVAVGMSFAPFFYINKTSLSNYFSPYEDCFHKNLQRVFMTIIDDLDTLV